MIDLVKKLMSFSLIFHLNIFSALASPKLQKQPNSEKKVLTYGNLIFEDNAQPQPPTHFVDLSYGFDSSDPLLDSGSFSVGYRHLLLDYFLIGAMVRKFHSEKSPLLVNIEEELNLIGADVDAERPDHAYYALLGILPLKGKLNFFGLNTFPFSLLITGGVGEKTMLNGRVYSGYILLVDSVLRVSPQWGLALTYSLEAEAAFQSRKTIQRDQLNFGVSYLF